MIFVVFYYFAFSCNYSAGSNSEAWVRYHRLLIGRANWLHDPRTVVMIPYVATTTVALAVVATALLVHDLFSTTMARGICIKYMAHATMIRNQSM